MFPKFKLTSLLLVFLATLPLFIRPSGALAKTPSLSCLTKLVPRSSVEEGTITVVFPVRNSCNVCIEARAKFLRDGQIIGNATNTFGPQFLIGPNITASAVARDSTPFKGSVTHSIQLEVIRECLPNYEQGINFP